MKINVITLFPDIFHHHLQYLPFRRALELNKLEFNIINLRDFALDSYGTVDGKPYGGGVGMLLRVEPIYNALKTIPGMPKTYLMSPRGQKFNQKMAEDFSKMEELTLICGRYEGVDERVNDFCDGLISVGDYVLSGGELPALIISESVTRLLPDVLEKEATDIESFTTDSFEFPQYTRPENFMGKTVPDVLISGDHAKIKKWRKSNSKKIK